MKKYITIILVIAMAICFTGCAGQAAAETSKCNCNSCSDTVKTIEPEVKTEDPIEEVELEEKSDDIRPELKEFLDGFEAFMNEYCEFLEKYGTADEAEQMSMLTDYVEMMGTYTELAEKIQGIDTSELSSAEMAYYMQVMARCEVRVIEAQEAIG